MSVLTREELQEQVADFVMDDLEIEKAVTRSPNGASSITFNGGSTKTSVISSNGASSDANNNATGDKPLTSYGINMNDPFRYGWRYVQNIADDGTIEYDQIPLTLEDLLHPEEEDFRMQNPAHTKANVYLHTVFSKQLGDEPKALVLYDTRVDWNVPGIKPFGPDITVIMDGEMDPPDKGTFVAREDGSSPLMAIEVTSPSTRKQDFFDKPILMQQVGLPYYFVVDLVAKEKQVYGYELNSAGCYVGIRPDEHGRVWMASVGLWLGLQGIEVECHNGQDQVMLDYAELAKVAEETETRLRAEAERADEESERADAEAQKAREADERAKAEAEKARVADKRADEAIRATEKAHIQMQILMERLHALGVDPETALST